MSCLHLVSFDNKATSLQQLRQMLADDDALLLMGAALSLADLFQDLQQPLYLWTAQTVAPDFSKAGTHIDADQLVALTLQYDKTMSWHD